MKTFSTAKVALLAAALSISAAASGQSIAPERTVEQDSDVSSPETIELSLDQAIQLAHSRSFRTARSRRNQQMAELRYQSTRSGYFPRANVGLNGDQSARGFSYASDQFEFDRPIREEFRGGLNGSFYMPIDFGGVIKRQVRQADVSREMSRYDGIQSTLDVTLEAQNNYLNALRAQTAVDADERVVNEIEELLKRSRTSAPSTVPFLEVELGNAQQNLTSSRTNADQAQDGLKQTLRVPPETPLRLTTRFSDRTEAIERKELLERAFVGRPDIQQAQLRIKQADISVKQVRDSRLPTVNLGGFYSDQMAARNILSSNRDRFSSKGFGLNINLPLMQYDNGQLSKQKRIALLQQEQAVADAEEIAERVGHDVRQALLAVERAENRIRTLPNRQQAYDALKRAEQQMLAAPEGQAQALLAQVSNARNAWRSAETASADAYIDYNSAVFRLKRAVGEGHIAQGASEQIASVPLMSVGTGMLR